MLHLPQPSTRQIKHFQYSEADLVGKGFSSEVFRGRNTLNGQPVAIKVISLRSIGTEVQKMLLANELKALRQLHHENIVETLDICQTATHVYIVMEYCNQGDLTSHIKLHGKYSQEEALRYFRQIVNGLNVMFSQGVLHRDLKTANILLKDGVAKIGDFGFCDFIHDQKGKHLKYNVGSPLYMSPEAYRKSLYSYKSEIWGAGIILYEMVLGEQPFKGIDYDSLVRSVASGAIYNTLAVSGFMKMLLSRMLSIDIGRRIDIGELMNLLNQNSQGPRIHSLSVPGRELQHTQQHMPAQFGPHTFMKKSIHSFGQQSIDGAMARQHSLGDLQNSQPGTPTTSTKPDLSFTKDSVASSAERLPLQQISSEANNRNQASLTKSTQLTNLNCADIAISANKPTTTDGISSHSFQKKKTQVVLPVLPSFPEPFKKTFQSKANLGSQPCLVSFQSHLTSYSARHPEFSSASQKLTTAKFLYRLCKLLSQAPENSKSRCKRLFFLALRHLELSLNHFQSENFFFIAQSSQQSSYKKILARTKQFRKDHSPERFSEDEYFMHIVTEQCNFYGEAALRYLQFWGRLALKDIGEQLQTITVNLTVSFGSYEVQQLFACYLYCLKYYELLEAMRGQSLGGDPPPELGLATLLQQQPDVSPQGFIGMAQQAKVLVK